MSDNRLNLSFIEQNKGAGAPRTLSSLKDCLIRHTTYQFRLLPCTIYLRRISRPVSGEM